MRTYVYIDGFNLYYGATKDTPYKWLDLKALFSRVLKPYNQILAIKYFTARVAARPNDLDAPVRQDAYIRALVAHIPEIEIIYGHFLQSKTRMRLANPTRGKTTEEVIKTEEKGSDVNLALHLLNDAWRDLYDCAVVCSNDSDLSLALQLVKKQSKKKLVLVVPGDPTVRPPAIQLKRFANSVIHICQEDLRNSQLPNPIPGTNIHRPVDWP